jgi:hypothetical protein
VSFIVAIMSILLSTWGMAALICALRDRTEQISVLEAYGRSGTQLHSYIWVTLLVGVVTFLGFLLFIIPGIIFTVWFCFAVFVVLVEGKKGTLALRTSREYVRGRWGAVFLRAFVLLLAAFGVLLLLTLGVALLAALMDIAGIAHTPAVIDAVSLGLGVAFSTVVPGFAATYMFLLYAELRSLKERFS